MEANIGQRIRGMLLFEECFSLLFVLICLEYTSGYPCVCVCVCVYYMYDETLPTALSCTEKATSVFHFYYQCLVGASCAHSDDGLWLFCHRLVCFCERCLMFLLVWCKVLQKIAFSFKDGASAIWKTVKEPFVHWSTGGSNKNQRRRLSAGKHS